MYTRYAKGTSVSMKTTVLILAMCFTTIAQADNDPQPFNPNITNSFNFSVSPHHLEELTWKHTVVLTINISCLDAAPGLYHLNVVSVDPSVAAVLHVEALHELTCSSSSSTNFDGEVVEEEQEEVEASYRATIYGEFIGRTYLRITVVKLGFAADGTDKPLQIEQYYKVTVTNKKTALNSIFIIVIAVMVCILNLGFGCKIDLNVVKAIARRPIPPAIGMSCQFFIMPLLGFALTYVLSMDKVLGFGLLVTASAPGGGGSNIWTFLLGGDLDLSITMTFFSKALALGMMPFWMFVLGRFYLPGTEIQIPYMNIVLGLLGILFPCLLGVLIASKKPVWARRVVSAVGPLSCVFVLWVIIVGSITNTYVYPLMARVWYVIPAGALLPYVGMLLGYALSRVFRQGNRRAVTIAIETGMQDSGIAIVLLLLSFPKPDGDIAATMAITAAMFTPMPLMLALVVITLYRRCWQGGKCQCCGGPDIVLNVEDLDEHEKEEEDEEHADDDVASNNTRNSELVVFPGGEVKEKENLINGNRLKNGETGQGDRVVSSHQFMPPAANNGHIM